jgi:hypothetical protein
MSDPVMSPDGKFMWSGSEWVPSPPQPIANLTDSVVSGEIAGGGILINPQQIFTVPVQRVNALIVERGGNSLFMCARIWGVIIHFAIIVRLLMEIYVKDVLMNRI